MRVKMLETADGSLESFDGNISATDLKIPLADAAEPTTDPVGQLAPLCARIPLSSSCRRALR
eukprot:5676413-Pyramimonas_sp.AAC.1